MNRQKDKIKRAAGIKDKASRSQEQSEPLTTEQLCRIWEKLRSDSDARGALRRLDEAGFRISHLTPHDASFKHPNWADYIAALPLLRNVPTTRRIHRKARFGKYSPLVRELREFASKMGVPFVEVKIFSTIDLTLTGISTLREDLLKTASILELFHSWDYYVRHVNPRNALIAELRWTIRERTGRPHDGELSVLIDAAFRAAGHKDGFYFDPTTLDRIEKRQREGRVKANRRVRDLIGAPTLSLSHSTRILRNLKKRV